MPSTTILTLTQSRNDEFFFVKTLVDFRCHDLDLRICFAQLFQPFRNADHVGEDYLRRVDFVLFSDQYLDGLHGGTTRGQHRVAQQNVGCFVGSDRGRKLAVKELGNLVWVRFVTLDEDLAYPNRRLNIPYDFQEGVPTSDDRDGADLRGIGAYKSLAGSDTSIANANIYEG